MYIGPHINCASFFAVFNDTLILSIFEKYSFVKFHENPSSLSRFVLYGRTETDRQTDMIDMTKLTVAFHTTSKIQFTKLDTMQK